MKGDDAFFYSTQKKCSYKVRICDRYSQVLILKNHTQNFNLAFIYNYFVVIWDHFHMTYHIYVNSTYRCMPKWIFWIFFLNFSYIPSFYGAIFDSSPPPIKVNSLIAYYNGEEYNDRITERVIQTWYGWTFTSRVSGRGNRIDPMFPSVHLSVYPCFHPSVSSSALSRPNRLTHYTKLCFLNSYDC